MQSTKEISIKSVITRLNSDYKKALPLFLEQENKIQAYILQGVTKKNRINIINALNDDQLVNILNHVDPDVATDLIQFLPRRKQGIIIKELKEELKNIVNILILFPPDVAAGLMKINYIMVESDETIKDTSLKFRNHELRTGKLPEILVLKQGTLVGYLPVYILGIAESTGIVGDYYKRVLKVTSNADSKKILELIKANPHNKIVVMGESNSVMGILYSDDVLQLIDSDNESLYSFAGVNSMETVLDSYKNKFKYRYKWLIVNLFTAFLAAFSVSLFNETISKYVLLAVYMPIIAGMGGNSATQTLAVIVRGLSQRQVTKENIWYIASNEVVSSLLNGILNGLIVGLIVIIFNGDIKLAIVLAMAMVINLLVAGIAGSIIPYIMEKLGKDPAASATIFITTVTDVLGFITFLGLATLILN